MTQSSASKAEQRRFQFRLPTFLLLLILIGGVVLGWLGRNSFTAAWRSFKAEREIRAVGARANEVFRDSQFQMLCSDKGRNAVLRFGNPGAIGDEELAHLKDLSTLGYSIEHLHLRGAAITDAGLVYLRDVPKLTRLELDNTGITDAGLVHLKELKDLEELSLSGTRVTETGLMNLEPLKHLKRLRLLETRVTDAGLVHLQQLPELENLSLDRTGVTDAGLVEMHKLKNLRELGLNGTAITDDGLRHLERLPQLELVGTAETQCTREGKDRLRQALPSCDVH